MAGIRDLSYYKNKICGCCGYTWDFPVVKEDMLSNIQKLYYFELNACKTCFCIGVDIEKVGDFEKNIQKNSEYKKIQATRNIPFSFVQKKEAYEYALYAYMCKTKGDIYQSVKSYVMAGIIEKEQRVGYENSLSYRAERDGALLKASEKTQQHYFVKAYDILSGLIEKNEVPDKINALLLLSYICVLMGDNEHSKLILNQVAKNKLTTLQVETIKDIARA